jgi:glycerate-2-kinase
MKKISPVFFSCTPAPHEIAAMIQGSLDRADPYAAVAELLQKNEKTHLLKKIGASIDSFKRIFLISIGKAAVPMAQGVVNFNSEQIKFGLVVCKNNDLNFSFSQNPGI